MKVGDLVKRKEGWMGWKNQRFGLVVNTNHAVIKVKWSDDYGTFSHPSPSLEVLSEAG